MKYSIDAKDKKIGRLASEIAILLMGKNSTAFQRNIAPKIEVLVTNANQMSITEAKKKSKEYKHYSGYPGGLREEKMEHALTKKGAGEVLRKTVYGMLPKNKLRSIMIKNLKITN